MHLDKRKKRLEDVCAQRNSTPKFNCFYYIIGKSTVQNVVLLI